MGYTKKAVRRTTLVFFSIVLASFFSYLIRLVLARKLTLEEFGLFYAIYAFITFLTLFRDLGLNSALVKYIPEFQIKKKYDQIKSAIVSVLVIQLISSFIIVAILFILSDFLAQNYFKNPLASPILKLLSLMLILIVFDDLLKKIFHGFQKMQLFSFIELGKNMTVLVLILLLFKFGLRIFSPPIAYLIASPIIFFSFLPYLPKVFKFFKYKLKISAKLTKKLVFFGLPTAFTAMGGQVIGHIDILILTYFTTLEQVGIYNIVLPTASLFLFFSRAIALVMMPMGSELWAKGEKEKLSDGLKRLQKYAFLIIIPISFSLISFSKLFLKVFFGNDFIEGAFPLQILLVGVIFFTVVQINNSVILGIGKPKIVAKIIIISASLNLIANLILIPKYGIYGAAFSTTLSYIIAFILSNLYASKLIGLKIPWIDLGKILVLGIISVLIIYALKSALFLNVWLELIITLLISSIIYIILLFLFRVLTTEEIKQIWDSIRM